MGWFKAFMLGGAYHTIGSVRALRRGGFTTDVRVHVLEPKSVGQPHRVSLELVSTGFLAYDTRSVRSRPCRRRTWLASFNRP